MWPMNPAGTVTPNAGPFPWPMNPAMYTNIPTDQVDWATLAQQWIQMKQVPGSSTTPSTRDSPRNLSDIEGGEAPMDMDSKDEDTGPQMGPADPNWNQQWSGNWQGPPWGWGWPSNPGTVPMVGNNSGSSRLEKAYWEDGEKIPPWVKHHRERLDKSHQPSKPVTMPEPEILDADKRRKLPAWIREGLTKMEREKQKKLEMESVRSRPSPDANIYPEEENNLSNDIPYEKQELKSSQISRNSRSHSRTPGGREEMSPKILQPLIRKSKDEIMEESMLKVRRVLTSILLEVTATEVELIAKEEFRKFRTGLNAYESDSEESDTAEQDGNGDSEEDLLAKIAERKKEFSKLEPELEREIEMKEDVERAILQQQSESDSESSEEIKSNNHIETKAPERHSRWDNGKGNESFEKDGGKSKSKSIERHADDSNGDRPPWRRDKSPHNVGDDGGVKKGKGRGKSVKKSRRVSSSSSTSSSSSSSSSSDSDDSDGKRRKGKGRKLKKQVGRRDKDNSPKAKRRRSRESPVKIKRKRDRSRSRNRSRSRTPRKDSYDSRRRRESPRSVLRKNYPDRRAQRTNSPDWKWRRGHSSSRESKSRKRR